MIYVSHPYGGKEENMRKVEGIVKSLSNLNINTTFVSPIHTFGFMYNDVSYERGIGMCINLLSHCNEMYVFGDYENSIGCCAEIEFCKSRRIPYFIMNEVDTICKTKQTQIHKH